MRYSERRPSFKKYIYGPASQSIKNGPPRRDACITKQSRIEERGVSIRGDGRRSREYLREQYRKLMPRPARISRDAEAPRRVLQPRRAASTTSSYPRRRINIVRWVSRPQAAPLRRLCSSFVSTEAADTHC